MLFFGSVRREDSGAWRGLWLTVVTGGPSLPKGREKHTDWGLLYLFGRPFLFWGVSDISLVFEGTALVFGHSLLLPRSAGTSIGISVCFSLKDLPSPQKVILFSLFFFFPLHPSLLLEI